MNLQTYFTNVGTSAVAFIKSLVAANSAPDTALATANATIATQNTELAAAKATIDAINNLLPTPIAQPTS